MPMARLFRANSTTSVVATSRVLIDRYPCFCAGALPAYARVEHRPHLGLALELGPVLSVQLHELSRNPDRFRLRIRLQDCPAPDNLLALAEWAAGHADLAVGEAHADAILGRQKTTCIDESTVLQRFLYELAK